MSAPRVVTDLSDLSAGAWIADRIGPFGSGVTSLVPAGFAAYARILHPARSASEEPVTWAAVAEWSGGTVHPLVQFTAMARPRTPAPERPRPWDTEPDTGELPAALRAALYEALGARTGTRQRCWFCLWDGWTYASPAVPAIRSRAPDRVAAIPAAAARGPRLRLPQREYLLFQGPLDTSWEIGYLVGEDRFIAHSPNLFWPDDRAWCVATDVDLDSTYVGGPRALVADLIADPMLEALPVEPADPISVGSDQLNRQ